MSEMTFDPGTLPALVAYINTRRAALRTSLKLARSYSGPDPAPNKTSADEAALETLTGVLNALRDIEANRAKARLAKCLDLEAD